MTDWRAYVREQLSRADAAPVDATVVDEIATQLHDIYDAAIRAGASADDAMGRVTAEIADWQSLARDLARSRAPVAAVTQPVAHAGGRILDRLPLGRTLALFLRDVRHAARVLQGQPLFTVTTLLAFALGIGATTVAYSLVHAVVLTPLTYPESDRLVFVRQTIPEIAHQYPVVGVNPRSFLLWQAQCASACDGLAAFTSDNATITGDGDAEGLTGLRATPEVFSLLGAAPLHGRVFTAAEAVPFQDTSVVLSHGFWQRRFGGDPAVVGRTIRLSDVPVTVVGVLPPAFRFPQLAHLDMTRLTSNVPDYIRPLAWSPERRTSWGEYENLVIMRLRRGTSLDSAHAELASLTKADFATAPIHPLPVLESLSGAITSQARRPLWMLFGAVATALLIACVNVANLLGARWMGRHRELAIRTAVGAGRGRLMSLVAAESLLLAGVGGVLGGAAAWLTLDAILARVPVDIPRLDAVRLDLPSLAFATVLTTVCALLCAVLPAWHAAGAQPADVLKDGARTTTDSGRLVSLRAWLVGGEVALTTMLLVVGGLLLASFANLLRVDPGFSTASIVSADLTLPRARYATEAERARFYDELLTVLGDTPGIAAASAAERVPLEGDGAVDAIIVDGDARPIGEQPIASHIQVSDNYFSTLGLTLRAGRLPTPGDRTRRVAVISERTAQTIWGSADKAVGRTFTRTNRDVSWEVLGVVADTRQWGLDREPGLIAYVPYRPQDARTQLSIVVRTRTGINAATVLERIRTAVQGLDPQLPLKRTQTLEEVVDRSLALRRFQLLLVVAFASVGLLLACLGIYGVSAQAVERRRNELAIRLALGATPALMRRLVVRQGLAPVVAGMALGLGLGVIVARALAAMFFGVTPSQPLVIVGTAAVVLVVGLAACLEPAARAARTKLALALRGS